MRKRKPEPQTNAPTNWRQILTSDRRALIFLIILAVIPRAIYLVELHGQPDFEQPWIDAAYHDVWARGLAFGDWSTPEGVADPEIQTLPYFRPPGYPYFLAATYLVSGGRYIAPRIAQMVLGLLNLILVYTIAFRLGGKPAARMAALIAAIYPVSIYFEGELLAVEPTATLLLLTLLAHERLLSRDVISNAAVAGSILGLTALFRPNVLLFAPVFAIWILWPFLRRRSGLQAKVLAIWLLSMLALVLPATIRNAVVADDPVLITSNAGINLYIGNNEQADGMSAVVPNIAAIAGLAEWTSFDYPRLVDGVSKRVGKRLSASDVSHHFTELALRDIAESPGRVLILTLRKAALFWSHAEISNNKEVSVAIQGSWALRWLPGFAFLFALAIAGWITARKARLDVNLLVVLVMLIVSLFASYLPFFVTSRFRAPILPMCFVLAGVGAAAIWNAMRRNARGSLGVFAATLIALVGSFIAARGYQPNTAVWHYHNGIALETKGQMDKAIQAYERALEADPNFSDAALKLGNAQYASGHLQPARSYWEQAARYQQPEAWNNLAWLLATAGDGLRDPKRAVSWAQRAVQATHRKDPGKLDTLAVALAADGRFQDAIRTIDEAIPLARAAGDASLVQELQSGRERFVQSRALP